MIHDGLWDYYFDEAMAAQGARVAAELGVTRAVQDEFAYQQPQARARGARSRQLRERDRADRTSRRKRKARSSSTRCRSRRARAFRALAGAAGSNGSVWDHVPPQNMVADPAQYSPYVTGDVPYTLVDRDEPVRADASLEVDGEAQADRRRRHDHGRQRAGRERRRGGARALAARSTRARSASEPLGEIVDHAGVAWDPPYLALVPAMAAQKLLDQQGLKASDIDVWEINEAFAAVALTSAARLGLDPTVDQHAGRRGRARPSDRRVGRAHRRRGRAAAAPARRRLRHRRDLLRRRSGRRRAGEGLGYRRCACSSSAPDRWAAASRRCSPRRGTRCCSTTSTKRAFASGIDGIAKRLDRDVEKGRIDARSSAARSSRTSIRGRTCTISTSQLAIEAATERLDLKLDLFRDARRATRRPKRFSRATRRRSRSPCSARRPRAPSAWSACTS